MTSPDRGEPARLLKNSSSRFIRKTQTPQSEQTSFMFEECSVAQEQEKAECDKKPI